MQRFLPDLQLMGLQILGIPLLDLLLLDIRPIAHYVDPNLIEAVYFTIAIYYHSNDSPNTN